MRRKKNYHVSSFHFRAFFAATPFSQLPILEYHGQLLGQSMAIARFLAAKVGVYGDDEMDRALIDGVVDYVGDYNNSKCQAVLRPWSD